MDNINSTNSINTLNITARTKRLLTRNDITTIEQLKAMSDEDFLKINRAGLTTLNEIKNALSLL